MDERRIPERPYLSKLVSPLLRPLNAFFDWIYHSEYNPFYRSGTLAIGLLFVLLATGTYLLFFYSVSNPYESVVAIQEQIWFGRWIRALHRYATDLALIAVFFHVFQLLAQGKTWGPRSLAWVSGVILLVALFTSAWTGYVMVWDQHGQALALAGTALLREIPFLHDELGRAFNGEVALPPSFFFMNLFLHIALPLGMVFGMWIHTARLARTVWFPIRSVFIGSLIALFALSLVVPAILLPKADLLQVLGRINVDWFFGFWIPIIENTSPLFILLSWIIMVLIGFSVPWWWRPRRSAEAPKSEVDVEGCNGCTQCTRDCPYEAITMVPHPNGRHLLAEISHDLCVSCGICAASCADLAIGPPGRDAKDQIQQVEAFCKANLQGTSEKQLVIVGCWHNDSLPAFLEHELATANDVHMYGLNCCGTLHSDSLEAILRDAGGVMLVGCAARNCMNRDGLDILKGRLYGKRVPFLSRDIDKQRIEVAPHSESEKAELRTQLQKLRTYVRDGVAEKEPGLFAAARVKPYLKRTVGTAVLIAATGFLSQAPMGTNPTHGLLRVTASLPSQAKQNCRALTSAERGSLPIHMQRPEICDTTTLYYTVKIEVDGTEMFTQELDPKGLRAELPIFFLEELEVAPGEHKVGVAITPTDSSLAKTYSLSFDDNVLVEKGAIHLIAFERPDSKVER